MIVAGQVSWKGYPVALVNKLTPKLSGCDGSATSIALRDLAFGTPDYHDFLQPGLNVIGIKVDVAKQQDYVLRALAVG
jgi:hypothetical protein